MKDGEGEMTWDTGNVYKGNWKDDMPDIFGEFRMSHSSPCGAGDVYIGNLKEGKMHGQGEWRWAKDGRVYNGNWNMGNKVVGGMTHKNGD